MYSVERGQKVDLEVHSQPLFGSPPQACGEVGQTQKRNNCVGQT